MEDTTIYSISMPLGPKPNIPYMSSWDNKYGSLEVFHIVLLSPVLGLFVFVTDMNCGICTHTQGGHLLLDVLGNHDIASPLSRHIWNCALMSHSQPRFPSPFAPTPPTSLSPLPLSSLFDQFMSMDRPSEKCL